MSRLPASSATPIEELSPRRRELLELIAKGLTNDEIAAALGITPGTVRSHVTTLLAQLELSNRTEAAAAFVARSASPGRVAVVMRRPAIAVLPIVALEDEPRTRAAAAALTEDLAALFSRWCWFPVISTSSSACARSPATRTFGGWGYSREQPIERLYRDSLAYIPAGLPTDRLRELLGCAMVGVDPWAYEPFDWLGPAGLRLDGK